MCMVFAAIMKRLVYYIFTAFTVIMAANGCVNIKGLEVTSIRMESVRPNGMRKLSFSMEVGIDNPSKEFQVYDMEGTIYKDRQELGDLTVEPVTVLAKSDMKYRVRAEFAMNGSLTFLDLMSMIPNSDLEEYRMDVRLTVKTKGGHAKKLKFRDVPAKSVMKMFR